MTQPNRDQATGYRYTYHSADNILAEVLADLAERGTNLTLLQMQNEEIARQKAVWEDTCERASVVAQDAGVDVVFRDFVPNLDNLTFDIDEPDIAGERDNVRYLLTWEGGRQYLAVTHSPIVGKFYLRDDNACDGDSPNADGYLGFTVYPDWLAVDPSKIDPPMQLDDDAPEVA